MLRRELAIPIGFDTDVNVAALGEHRWGNAQGIETFIYLTVGTGIGGGGWVSGKPIHGLLLFCGDGSHPDSARFIGRSVCRICPFHQDCLEGLASGFAMEKRWGQRADSLPADHPAWALEAHYLATGLVNFILMLSPERIIMGGGVMTQQQLFSLMRSKVCEKLNNYLDVPKIMSEIEDYIVLPKLGDQAGILGALALAQQVLETEKSAG